MELLTAALVGAIICLSGFIAGKRAVGVEYERVTQAEDQ